MPVFSSLDKDQIKVVIDEVTRWLDSAEEGDWMTLPGIAGRQEAAPSARGCWGRSPSGAGVGGHIPLLPVDAGRWLGVLSLGLDKALTSTQKPEAF